MAALIRAAAVAASVLIPPALAATPERGESPVVSEFHRIRPATPDPDRGQMLSFRAYGTDWQLDLTDNETLLEALPGHGRRALAEAGHRFFRGEVAGRPGSWVRLSWVGGRFTGGFYDGRELYLVDRAGDLGISGPAGVPPGDTVVFRFSDLDLDRFIDHGAVRGRTRPAATAEAGDYEKFVGHLQEVSALQGSAMMAMPVTIVTDTRFNVRHGADAAAVAAGRLNFVDGIYSSELGTGIVLWHHEALDSDANLTSSDAGTLLEQFRQFMNGGAGSDLPFRGLAHLFSGRDFDGSTIGIAFFSPDGSVLGKRRSGLGVDQDLSSETTSALLFAHETGHNFNARHDDNTDFCPAGTLQGIMASTINGSEEFSQCSLDVMGQTVATAGCLVESTVIEDVFSDGFENP